MILGVDPKVDYAFKHMLGRDVTRPILIDVIDSVLQPAPGRQTRDVILLNPFNPKEALDDKLSILDIKARDQSGRQLNIEMQMLAFRAYPKRIVRLYFLRYAEKMDTEALPPALQRPEVLRALEELKMLTQTDLERERYES